VFVYATPVVESACFGHGFSHTDTLAQLLTAGESAHGSLRHRKTWLGASLFGVGLFSNSYTLLMFFCPYNHQTSYN